MICTHLGLAGSERRFQVGVLRALLDSDTDTDTLLMGDVNDWRRRGVSERLLAPALGPGTSDRTFPAAFPMFPLDRLWFRPADRLIRSRVVREAGRASDHLPLVADLAARPDGRRETAATARSSQRSSSPESAMATSGTV